MDDILLMKKSNTIKQTFQNYFFPFIVWKAKNIQKII